MIHCDKFLIEAGFHGSVELVCTICRDRNWGQRFIYYWAQDEEANVATIVSRAEGHWNQTHLKEDS